MARTADIDIKGEVAHIHQPSEADAIAQIARESIDVMDVDMSTPQIALAPEGTQKIEIGGWFERPYYEIQPGREYGVHRPATVDAFVDLVNTLENPKGQLSVWVPVQRGSIVAVLNDHGDGGAPGWGDHRAVLDLATTPEWDHWMKLHNQLVGQEDFANHIEEGLDEVRQPDGAELLEVAQSIEASLGGRFKKSHRLADGRVQMEYTEEIDAAAGEDGQLTIPHEIELGIAPFAGEDPYKIKARFRYRINSGKLALGYKLDRPELVLRDAFEGIADRLEGEFARVYIGTPSRSRGISD